MPGDIFGDGWDLSQQFFAEKLLKYITQGVFFVKPYDKNYQFSSLFMITLTPINQFSEVLLAQPTLKKSRHV